MFCLHVCVLSVCLVSVEARTGCWMSWSYIACEPLCECCGAWELIPDPLEEQQPLKDTAAYLYFYLCICLSVSVCVHVFVCLCVVCMKLSLKARGAWVLWS